MRFKRMLYLLLTIVLALGALILWMAGGVQSPRSFDGEVQQISAIGTSTRTDGLTVVSWNIAWGYGWGSEGSGGARPKRHFDDSIQKIGETLRNFDADVVLLQEVDFDSTRSHHVDQAKAIAKIAGYRWVAYAESWTAKWVPFPYWPIEDHYGAMRSGGAILSRFPLSANRVELLDKPAENPFWYNLFYLFRFFQSVRIDVGGRAVQVFNTHLDAFSRTNREAQATYIATLVADTDGPIVFGGDFNSVPPESAVRGQYPDEPETDHDGDTTIATMRGIEGLRDTVNADRFMNEQTSLFTFPAHEPNRKLDHLFVNADFECTDSGVMNAGDVSDHLPVFARIEFVED